MAFGSAAFGKWWGHGRAHMSGISDPIKETQELPSPSTVWGHRGKAAVYEPGQGVFLDTESACVLTLDFPVPSIVRNDCCL